MGTVRIYKDYAMLLSTCHWSRIRSLLVKTTTAPGWNHLTNGAESSGTLIQSIIWLLECSGITSSCDLFVGNKLEAIRPSRTFYSEPQKIFNASFTPCLHSSHFALLGLMGWTIKLQDGEKTATMKGNWKNRPCLADIPSGSSRGL